MVKVERMYKKVGMCRKYFYAYAGVYLFVAVINLIGFAKGGFATFFNVMQWTLFFFAIAYYIRIRINLRTAQNYDKIRAKIMASLLSDISEDEGLSDEEALSMYASDKSYFIEQAEELF